MAIQKRNAMIKLPLPGPQSQVIYQTFVHSLHRYVWFSEKVILLIIDTLNNTIQQGMLKMLTIVES